MRQAKSGNEESTKLASVRVLLSHSEKAKCQRLAAADGRSVSSYVRQIILDAIGMKPKRRQA